MQSYAEATPAEAAEDLLADLRHLCDDKGLHFNRIVVRSLPNYLDERNDRRTFK